MQISLARNRMEEWHFRQAIFICRLNPYRASSMRIFSERSLTIRNDYVHRLLLKKGQAASDDLINRVRSELVVASPTRPEARLRIFG